MATPENLLLPSAQLPRFDQTLEKHGWSPLTRTTLETLQINVGKVCNQACHHCHVDAGPNRTESMTQETMERILELLAQTPTIKTIDITGGAPELNPHFQWLVRQATSLQKQVIDRCNLTILLQPGQENLPAFLAQNQVEIVASLPCYLEENVDRQRGHGVYEKSIEAIRTLNRIGYGQPDSSLTLNLVYNPIGPILPPSVSSLEEQYRIELRRHYDIVFHRLYTITNMPIHRFAHDLRRNGNLDSYMGLLVNHFNPATVGEVMCRSLVSVGWEGTLYDCDFNQMLEIPVSRENVERLSVWDLTSLDDIERFPVQTANHCFGCTAGEGSSCGGALA